MIPDQFYNIRSYVCILRNSHVCMYVHIVAYVCICIRKYSFLKIKVHTYSMYIHCTYGCMHVLTTYSRVQKKVNVAYRNYYVITDRSTNCYLPIPLSV